MHLPNRQYKVLSRLILGGLKVSVAEAERVVKLAVNFASLAEGSADKIRNRELVSLRNLSTIWITMTNK